MSIFLICIFMFLFLLMIITLAWGGYELIADDEVMSGIIFFLADIGLISAWLYVLINHVIPSF